jgi:hypothetical protein
VVNGLLIDEPQLNSLLLNSIVLSNGKRVANFSSPHPFTFVDGSVLPAVSNEDSLKLSIKFLEMVDANGDVTLSFDSTPEVDDMIDYWMWEYHMNHIDVVFCPLPMITMLKERGFDVKKSPFRSVRMEDRISKLVSIDKQCV